MNNIKDLFIIRNNKIISIKLINNEFVLRINNSITNHFCPIQLKEYLKQHNIQLPRYVK